MEEMGPLCSCIDASITCWPLETAQTRTCATRRPRRGVMSACARALLHSSLRSLASTSTSCARPSPAMHACAVCAVCASRVRAARTLPSAPPETSFFPSCVGQMEVTPFLGTTPPDELPTPVSW
eukprot:6184923-Pleurochrysis_carterae.AAC.4